MSDVALVPPGAPYRPFRYGPQPFRQLTFEMARGPSTIDGCMNDQMQAQAGTSDLAYLVTRLTNFGPGAPPSMVEYVIGLSMRSPIEVWTDGIAALIEMDLRHAIEHVRCPALVIVGDLDRLTPPASALAIKDALPDGRLVVLEGAGHMAPMERHEQFNDVTRAFLSDVVDRVEARP